MSSNGNLGGFVMLRGKLAPGHCAECATVHDPKEPHNQQSLFYQYSFRERHGRWPTWADALAHCTPDVRKEWVDGLAEHGVIVPTFMKQPIDEKESRRLVAFGIAKRWIIPANPQPAVPVMGRPRKAKGYK